MASWKPWGFMGPPGAPAPESAFAVSMEEEGPLAQWRHWLTVPQNGVFVAFPNVAN